MGLLDEHLIHRMCLEMKGKYQWPEYLKDKSTDWSVDKFDLGRTGEKGKS